MVRRSHGGSGGGPGGRATGDPLGREKPLRPLRVRQRMQLFEQAILAAERVIELRPSFALGHFSLGVAHQRAGFRGDHALSARTETESYDPQNPVWSNFLAVGQFFASNPESALLTSAHALGTRPDWRPIVETVACCYATTGKWDEARRCVQQMTGMPEMPYAALAPFWERNPHWRDQFDDLLRKAGGGRNWPLVSKRR